MTEPTNTTPVAVESAPAAPIRPEAQPRKRPIPRDVKGSPITMQQAVLALAKGKHIKSGATGELFHQVGKGDQAFVWGEVYDEDDDILECTKLPPNVFAKLYGDPNHPLVLLD